MLYLDNIIFSLQKHGGVSVLWGNLITELLLQDKKIHCLEYKNSDKNSVRKNILLSDDKLTKYNKNLLLERFDNINLPEDNVLFHSSHYRIAKNKLVKNITTVHDFTYEFFYSGIRKKLHCWQKYNAILKADKIICISQNTKRDLMHFLPEVEESKISVIYNGVSEDYKPLSIIDTDYSDYILYVGGRQSYKNFNFAVNLAKKTNLKLLIVGDTLISFEQKYLHENLGEENYQLIKYPNNQELNKLYNSCFALIYPSSYEGFGIPIIEAQKAGCPVIALNKSSIPEIIGKNALLIQDLDYVKASNYLSQLKKDSFRKEIIETGFENSHRFSWHQSISEYLNIYDELDPYI